MNDVGRVSFGSNLQQGTTQCDWVDTYRVCMIRTESLKGRRLSVCVSLDGKWSDAIPMMSSFRFLLEATTLLCARVEYNKAAPLGAIKSTARSRTTPDLYEAKRQTYRQK